MDSICVRLESNTVTAEKEVVKNMNWCCHYEKGLLSLLGGYTECCRAQVMYSLSFTQCPEDDDDINLYVSFCSSMMTHDLPL